METLARSGDMGFSIVTDTGWLGGLVILLGIAAAVIVAIFFFSAANLARTEVIEEERDEGHDPPIA